MVNIHCFHSLRFSVHGVTRCASNWSVAHVWREVCVLRCYPLAQVEQVGVWFASATASWWVLIPSVLGGGCVSSAVKIHWGIDLLHAS